MTVQILCINKDDRKNPYERITHIGGKNVNGNRWKMTQQQAISDIKSGKYSFYVEVRGDRADVIVARSRFGNDYIKTVSDGDEPNNLLSLPECT
ncbi:DUF3892 domain-containing protein [Candidatus Peregrinibacteria bacterium]|nr:DUF3892 domain-containing protein [Candidatus Peregrinibacteria bacterium]